MYKLAGVLRNRCTTRGLRAGRTVRGEGGGIGLEEETLWYFLTYVHGIGKCDEWRKK